MDISSTSGAGTQAPAALFAEDLLLAQALLQRDRKATAKFVGLHTDPLIRYLRARLLPRADLVDDIAQETFLAAWRNLENYRGTSPLRAWLLGIARHKVEDYYRSQLRSHTDSLAEGDDFQDTAPGPDTLLDRGRASAWTWEILAELPETYALVLRWRYWEQRSANEMAIAAGRTEKSVERLLSRARMQFREKWLARQSSPTAKGAM